jgi:pimeloyl-ACP methyl ester carboxylesterase
MKLTQPVAAALLLCLGGTAPADQPVDPLAKAPSHFAKLGDIRVHYKSLGRGKTALVFVHGWTCDMTFWRSQVPAFEGKIRMLLVDLPGHGRSDKPKVNYTIDRFARAAGAVLKDAGVSKAILVGHSMGTPVIRQFYRLYPEKTAALVVVDGALKMPNVDPARFKRFIDAFEGPDYQGNLSRAVDGMFAKAPAELRDRAKVVMTKTPQHVAVSAMKDMWRKDLYKEDPIKVPLLVVVAKSGPWPAGYEKFVRKLAPDVDYHAMDGVGHFLMLEKPEAFNKILAGFLAAHKFLGR